MGRLVINILFFIIVAGICTAQQLEAVTIHFSNDRLNGEQDTLSDTRPLVDSSLKTFIESIEQRITSGTVQLPSQDFGRQVYMMIRGKEGGYYSNNQASYILQNYFSGRRALNFRFTTTSMTGKTPYVTGGGMFMVKGNTEILQIYIALSSVNGRWIITQWNIY